MKYHMTDPLGEMILQDDKGRVIAKGFDPVDKVAYQKFLDKYSFPLTGELKRLWDELFAPLREGSHEEPNTKHEEREETQTRDNTRSVRNPPHIERIANALNRLIPQDQWDFVRQYCKGLISRPCLLVSLDGIISRFELPSYNERTILEYSRNKERVYLKAREVCLDRNLRLLNMQSGNLYDWSFARKGEIGIGKWVIQNYQKDILKTLEAYNDLALRCRVPGVSINPQLEKGF